MNTSERLGALRRFPWPEIQDVRPTEKPLVPECDLTLATRIALAFLKLVPAQAKLQDVWATIQDQIGMWQDRHSVLEPIPALYLVLLTEDRLDLTDVIAQSIASDPYVCRKVVVEWADRPLDEVLAGLPFWPLERPAGSLQDVTDPASSMWAKGFDRAWVESLLGRPSAEALVRELRAGNRQIRHLDPTPEDGTGLGAVAASPRQHAAIWHLSRAEIEGFRGIGGPLGVDLDAALVAIYGRNGTGKTSLCESLEWAFTGVVSRFQSAYHDSLPDADSPVYHLSGRPVSVTLTMIPSNGTGGTPSNRVIERRMDRSGRQPFTLNGASIPVIRDQIMRSLDARLPDHTSPAQVRDAFRRYHLLDQDRLLEFLRDTRPEQRYEALRPMLGTAEYGRAEAGAAEVTRILGVELGALDAVIRERAVEVQEARAQMERCQQEIERWIHPIDERSWQDVYREAAEGAISAGVVESAAEDPDSGQMLAFAEFLAQAVPHAQDTSRADRAMLVDLAARAEQEPSRATEIRRLKSECDTLIAERGRLHQQIEDARRQLDDATSKAEALRQAAATAMARLQALREANELAAAIASKQREIHQLDLQLAPLRAAESTASLSVVAAREQLSALRSDYAAICDRRDTATEQANLLRQAVHAFASWVAATQALANLTAGIEQIHDQLAQATAAVGEQQAAYDRLRQQAEPLDADIERLGRLADDRARLLTALQAHIESNKCPFCGHVWQTAEDLRVAVEDVLSTASDPLATVQATKVSIVQEQERIGAGIRESQEAERILQERMQALDSELRQWDSTQRESASFIRSTIGCDPDEQLGTRLTTQIDAQEKLAAEAERALANLAPSVAQAETGLSETERAEAEAREKTAALQTRLDASTWELTSLEMRRRESLGPSEQDTVSERAALEAALLSNQSAGASQTEIIGECRRTLQLLEEQLRSANAREAEARRALSRAEDDSARLRFDLEGVGLSGDATSHELVERIRDVEALLARLNALLGLVDLCGTYAELRRSEEHRTDAVAALQSAEERLRVLKEEARGLRVLAGQSESLTQTLRQVSSTIERERLNAYEPWIARIHRRLSGHPLLGDLKVVFEESERRFFLRLAHPFERGSEISAPAYLSLAQANAAALSVFLASALLQGWSSLGTVILDDPVQHLDDLNAFGLLDLLYSISTLGHQVIVTTANVDLYKLMLARFSRLNRNGRRAFLAHRLVGITPQGPALHTDAGLP